jgi:general stress protein YciG
LERGKIVTEKKPRGFATLTPERRREVASMGGKAVAPEKRYYSDRANASAAGVKGGLSPKRRKTPDASV